MAKFDDGARHAEVRSSDGDDATLFSVGNLIERPVVDPAGATIGHSVGAMLRCHDGGIAYLVIAEGGVGGVGERLHAIAWRDVAVHDSNLSLRIDAAALAALPVVDPQHWPTTPPLELRAA